MRSRLVPHRHLPSIFANIHELEFAPADPGAPSKVAIAMKSGEMERVGFVGPCSCEGPVGMHKKRGTLLSTCILHMIRCSPAC